MPDQTIEKLKELHDDLTSASKAKSGKAWFHADYCGGMAREVGKAIKELEKPKEKAEFRALGDQGQDIFY